MYQCVTYIRYTVGVYFLSQLSSRRNCLCLCTVFIELCCHLAAADDSLVDSDVKKLLRGKHACSSFVDFSIKFIGHDKLKDSWIMMKTCIILLIVLITVYFIDSDMGELI